MSAWPELQARKMQLSLMQNIPDMALYAVAWECLAADFVAIGADANAEYCRSRAKHYGELAGGEWVRLIEMPVAELIEAS